LCERRKFDPGSGAVLEGHGLARAVLGWAGTNAFVSALGWFTRTPYRVLRYESFATSPNAALGEIADFVHEPVPPRIPVDGIDPGIQHQVAGNPVRFSRGPIPIRLDEEWRKRMSWPARAAVTATTWPLLVFYPRRDR
jgi:hypothetical protein